jgi:CheY-like chemotaxis protein
LPCVFLCYNMVNHKQNESKKMPKVLLVEDDNNLREIFDMRLQAEGYKTITAGDGEEALVIAVKEKPDLIIADVMMPKLSGFEMVENMRAAPELAKVKVIMMTALGQAEDQARGEKLGVVKYLVKSQVTLEDFVRVVREVMPPDQSASVPTPSQPDSAAESAPTSTPKPENINKSQESEASMQDDASQPQTNPVPDAGAAPAADPAAMPAADPGAAGANPISGGAAPMGDVASTAPQSAAEETSAVQDQINNFESDPAAGTAPSMPASDSSMPAADNSSLGVAPAAPSDAMPASDPAVDSAAPAGDAPAADAGTPSMPMPDPNAPASGQAPEGTTPEAPSAL